MPIRTGEQFLKARKSSPYSGDRSRISSSTAIGQPEDVDVNEILSRLTRREL